MSFYVLAVDGIVKKYPYTLTDMRRDNPDIGFASLITDDVAAKHNTFPVQDTQPPSINPATQYIVRAIPENISGKWVERWDVKSYTPTELSERLDEWRQSASCTPFQGRMALSDAGLLASVEAAIAQADEKTKVAWEYALEWKRMSPMIATLGAALNLTDAEIDDLFKAAAEISA
jgi:hypothetical protein